MKKLFSIVFLCVLFSGAVFCEQFKPKSKVYVSVKSTYLKSGTEFFSSKVCQASYGDCLIVLESNDKFSKVFFNDNLSLAGWISNGSITKRKIYKNSYSSAATQDELALAGKGFSKNAEDAFKSYKKNLNYNLIDEMEKISVSDSELTDFIKQGHLSEESEYEM